MVELDEAEVALEESAEELDVPPVELEVPPVELDASVEEVDEVKESARDDWVEGMDGEVQETIARSETARIGSVLTVFMRASSFEP